MVPKLAAVDGPEPPQYVGYLYMVVADEVEEHIRTGELPVRSMLPNERRMAQVLGVSLGTARRVVEELRDRGLVFTLPAKGTFVVSRERGEPMSAEQAMSVWRHRGR